jgi:hypothetical protein
MPLPAAEAMQHAPAAAAPAAAMNRISTINSFTGLSTDYLNHFTEAVMILEMGTIAPECLEDLRDWRTKTYREHFLSSHFRDRDAVIAAYDAASPAVRHALDAVSETLNSVLLEARNALVRPSARPNADTIARRAVARTKPLITRAAAIINGTADKAPTQAAIDALFAR